MVPNWQGSAANEILKIIEFPLISLIVTFLNNIQVVTRKSDDQIFPDPKGDDKDCDIVEWQDPKHESFSDPNTICAFYEDNVEFGWLSGCPIIVVQLIHLFGFYWCVNTVVAIGQFTLAGSFSQWYWTQRDNYVLLSKRPLGQGKFPYLYKKATYLILA